MSRVKNGSYGIKEFNNELNNILKYKYPKYATELLNEMANRVMAMTKKSSPVDTGQLRRSWEISSIKKTGTDYSVEVFTSIDYASYMEFGHKLRDGKWYKGKFMLTMSIKKLENQMPSLTNKFYNKLLKEFKL